MLGIRRSELPSGSPEAGNLKTRILPSAFVLTLALGPSLQAGPPVPPRGDAFQRAEARAKVAREAFVRARGVLDGWYALKDPASGLLPRTVDQAVWAPCDNAADLLPFLFLAAHFTRPERVADLEAVYRQELLLTTRAGGLPDWYSFDERRFLHQTQDPARIIFGATEYAKDGLNPLIELLGPEPWQARLRQLLEGVFELAPVESAFGRLPSQSAEVNGELLQTLARFYCLTGEVRFLEWGERIADAYCLEVLAGDRLLPAHRFDFTRHVAADDRLSLNDHGNEIVGGLAELFFVVHALGRESAARYEAPLRRMFDTLLERGRNPDGLWYGLLEASTGKVLAENVPDTWGYALAGALTFGRAAGEPRYEAAARQALRGVNQERYLDWGGADSFADSIEGALLLLNRLPEPAGWEWFERIVPRFFEKQKLAADGGDGIVEGWYGDGNYARTALMIALALTRGVSAENWSEHLLLGADTDEDRLLLSVSCDQAFAGRLRFDHPRHRDHYRLPFNYPRLNEFPEWFTVSPGRLYRVEIDFGQGQVVEQIRSGGELIAGLPLDLAAGGAARIRVVPLSDPPYGQEPPPLDPFVGLDQAGDPALLDRIDLQGGGEYRGETYLWTKDGAIDWRPELGRAVSDSTLWLRFGCKGGRRACVVRIGERAVQIERGGYDGFTWCALDLPASWLSEAGGRIRIEAPGGQVAPGFLSALRLRRLRARPDVDAVLLEAEDFEGGWRAQTNIPGFQGRGFRTSNAAGRAREGLTASVELEAGRYNVWARGYEGDEQDRRFLVQVAGLALSATHRDRRQGRFSWQFAGSVELSAGRHTVEIQDAGGGFESADAVLLSRDLAFDPGVRERLERTPLLAADAADLVGRIVEECSHTAERSHQQVRAHQTSADEWAHQRTALRGRLLDALGLDPFPRRTPLKARTTGVLLREGYRIEKVVFESRPGFPVTANVYVPDPGPGAEAAGRRPAVLCPVGHWGLSKAEPVVQARCIGLAKMGVLALTYDAVGQGERQVDGNGHAESFRSVLVGRNNLSFLLWDTLRALDYLLERDDVDPDRIACTGASGGGLNTLFAAAIDERIQVAVPVVFVTRIREFLETRRTHCPCSHVNGLAEFMDIGDVAALIAPRPLLFVTATRDPEFLPRGAFGAAEQAASAYELLGASDRLAVQEFDSGHDYNQPMREAMYGWLGRFGFGTRAAEPEFQTESDPAVLNCLPEGRVFAASETMQSLAAARAAELLAAPPKDAGQTRRRMRALVRPTGDEQVQLLPIDPGLSTLRLAVLDANRGLPLLYRSSEGFDLVARSFEGARPDGPLVLVLAEAQGGAGFDPELLEAARAQASRLLVIDPRGTAGGRDEHLLATDSLLLGDPLIARRARVLSALSRSLRGDLDPGRALVWLAAGQRSALTALLAQGAGGGASGLALLGLPASLAEWFAAPLPPRDLVAWKLLELGDLDSWTAAAGVPVVRLAGPDFAKPLTALFDQL